MKRKSLALMGVLLGSILATSFSNAHAIWFAERATQVALIYGVGADDLDTVKRKDLVTNVGSYDQDWEQVDTELVQAGPLMLPLADGLPVVYTAVMDNGTWSKTPDGKWLKKGRDEVPDAVIATRNYKYAVHIRGELTSKIPAFEDQKLQIIPVDAKLPEFKDQPLKLQVLFEGKPAEGVQIKPDFVTDPDSKPLTTDANGMVTVNVRNQGLNVILALYIGPADDPKKVDEVEHAATLSFALGHEPE